MSSEEKNIREQKIIEKFERFKKQQVEDILAEVEKLKIKAKKKKLNYTIITREKLENKLEKSNSPMIVTQWWHSVAPGETLNYTIFIQNPDPIQHRLLFIHTFIGIANIVADLGSAVAAVDPRFPRITVPDWTGLTIDPGATEILEIPIPIPATIETANYIGNSFLFTYIYSDVDEFFDRDSFIFKVE